ncbi:hypothetical protein AGABI1DRAFT_114696 [Agaricus bisporus var. burnettii JB137-S8]|uniref:Oxidoreductase-like domain-containing protein n=1 Tax=Agaricus bisporus var. burnettii (strain JB137-S8 / ATCC MYA-4627 / FGSC 10392) TaxID=597362 RepID=K5XTP2_AGABU|nr:uncharacterized protein AGABI1DRAFT_114696 [Agaricus bisporus var. burnettii JB137-S8]EKM78410.1 hypothetical protein AGABI1DRAFT_114696 [Agaricus bisporus var. burnettii JB137-S8]
MTTFKGFVVPIQPLPPHSDECCMSGCAVCVYDLYEESLEAYNESLDTLRKQLTEMNVPEYEWPKHIQTHQLKKSTNVVMNAFEEMERRLKEKHKENSRVILSSQLYTRPPQSRRPFDWTEFWDGLRWLIFSNR